MSGPRESSSSGSIVSPWLGRLRSHASPRDAHRDAIGASTHVSRKGKEKVDQPFMPDMSGGHSSSGSEQSLNEELGIPAVVTPGVQRTKTTLRTPGSDPGVRRSTRVKYPVNRLRYDSYTSHHYAYMVKAIHEVEPTCFE